MTSHDRPATHPLTDRDLLDRWVEREDAEAFHELVARHGRMVLGVCRRILGDVHLADDLAQDCFLRLAEQGSGKARNVAGWLHAVAANAAKTARRDRRRREVEPIEEVQQEGFDPATPARVAAWRELEGEVDAAISALPEALREVVVGHFLEGRSHRELGRELGLGDRTVGYRIAKGIERLRRELAARGIRVDREALGVALVALPTPASVPVGWSASLGKVALAGPMEMGAATTMTALVWASSGSAKSVLVGVLALLAGLLGSLWIARDAEHVARTGLGLGPGEVRVAANPTAEASEHTTDERREVLPSRDTEPPSQEQDPDEVALSGRCVDAAGRPLAGATVDLEGRPGGEQAMRRYLVAHEAPQWTDPEPVLTGVDGRFAFRVLPPSPYGFEITARIPGGVPMSIHLGSLEPGTSEDLGDVELSPGFQLGGAVKDLDGQPVADLSLFLWREGGARYDAESREIVGQVSRWQPPQIVRSRTDSLGDLIFSQPVLAGARYTVRVDKRTVYEPSRPFPLLTSRPEIAVTVGEPPSPAEPGTRPGIAGRVSSITGESLQGVHIYAERPDGTPWSRTSTDRAGAFDVLRHPDRMDEESTRLRATCLGYVDWTSSEPVSWATQDLAITLRRGPTLELRVVRDQDGAPVDQFGMTAWRLPRPKAFNLEPELQLALEDHPGGMSSFESFTPGRWWIDVQIPESLDWGAPAPVEVEVREGQAAHVEFRVPRLTALECVVVHADGSPAVGLPVELLRPAPGEAARLDQVATGRAAIPVNIPGAVIELVDSGSTDAAGRCTLTGPAGIDCAVRLPGPGNLPTIQQPVRCDVGVPLEIVLPPCAKVRGMLSPPDIVAALRSEGSPDAQPGLGVRLVDPASAYRTVPVDRYAKHGLPVSEDGSFEIAGVPAGIWDIELCWPRVQDGRITWVKSIVLRNLTVRPEQCEDVRIDLEALRRHPFHIRVLHNGEPWPALVHFVRETHHDSHQLLRAEDQHLFQCDVHGELACSLPAGTWRPEAVIVCHDGQHGSVTLPPIEVGPNSPTERTLAFEVGSRRVRIESPDGSPMRQVTFPGFAMVQSDTAGRTIIRGAPGTHRLQLLRKPFWDLDLWIRWQNEHDRSEHPRAWVTVGEVTLLTSDGPEQVVRLPEELLKLPD